MHVDLLRYGGKPYDPSVITFRLNKHFNKTGTPIRILKTYLVPNEFSSRHAISRTYMYRLAVVRAETETSNLMEHIPIEELGRCLFVW